MKSTKAAFSAVILAGGVLLSSGAVLAHHSFAMFNPEKRVTIEGTVKEYQWANPHVWLDVMVPDDQGNLTRWGIESQSPAILFRRGWKPEDIKAGDKVKVEVFPMRDGTPGGQMLVVTLPDGRVLKTAMGERN